MLTKIDPGKFETLIEVSALINSNYADAKTLLTRILESATRLTEGEASSLILKSKLDGKLYFEIALGAKSKDLKKFQLEPGQGIAGWVALHNKSLIVNDTSSDERHFEGISKSIGFETRNILTVPMRVKDECVGVIEIINKKGNRDFTEEDLHWLELFAVQAAIAIENARYLEKAKDEIHFLQDQIKAESGFHTLVAESHIIKEKLALVSRIASTDSSVLILGESGAGKELFAERIHLESARRGKPFIRVNCAALPDTLLESELFGHVKGAFTDATQNRRGRFDLADGGTIFLDEIGDFPLQLQPKLLRVLQFKTFEPLGSSESKEVNVRIIAATNQDIERLVEEGKFRSDLYYRLNVLPLHIPPLRDRKEDIPVLADFFLKKFSRETKKTFMGFSDGALERMLSFNWPGNVRELENAVERSCVISKGKWIEPQDLLLSGPENAVQYGGKSLKDAVTVFKQQFVINALRENDWNQTETAKVLDIQRTYLSRLIKDLEITCSKE